jgi:hypothetical protein
MKILLDTGTSSALLKFSQELEWSTSAEQEKVTGFPAVAGDIVFFTTNTYVTDTPCTPLNTSTYAFTYTGGPAYDNTGDNQIKTSGNPSNRDTAKFFTQSNARGTAPFIVDQHLAIGVGNKVELFGDERDFNNGIGQSSVRLLSWREVR